jgi:hypothetical protein
MLVLAARLEVFDQPVDPLEMYVTLLDPVMKRTPPLALTLNVPAPVTDSLSTALAEDSPNELFGME